MSTETNTHASNGVAANPADVYGRVAQLAWEATSPSRYYAEALQCVAESFGSPFAAIEVQLSSQTVSESYHNGPTDPGFWKPPVQELLTTVLAEGESLSQAYHANGGDVQIAMLASVLRTSSGAVLGAMAVVIVGGESEQVAQYQTVLDSMAGLIANCSAFTGRAAPAVGDGGDAGLSLILGKASTYHSRQEMAFAIVNNLRNRTGCAQVGLGVVHGSRVKVIAISGMHELRARTPGVSRIRSAMEECLDHGKPIAYPPAGDDAIGLFLLHKQWHSAVGGAATASIPLLDEGRPIAVLSCQRDGAKPFDVEKLAQLGATIAPYVTAMGLVDRATRGLVAHAWAAIRRAARSVTAPGHWMRKAALAACLILAGWVCFGTIDYSVTTNCTVMSAQMRHFSAPLSSELQLASVAPGDRVSAGDVLCRFNTHHLLADRAQLTADIQIARIQQKEAMRDNDSTKAQLAAATIAKLEAMAKIVDQQIEQATITAPFDGVVLSGDLRRRVGQILPQGEPLYEVSPESGWILQIHVPESASADMAADLAGEFTSHVRPGSQQPFNVLRVHPSAETTGGDNIYIVEARLDGDAAWLRNGMEGMAKVNIGPRPVWWVLSHRVIDYFRVKLWL